MLANVVIFLFVVDELQLAAQVDDVATHIVVVLDFILDCFVLGSGSLGLGAGLSCLTQTSLVVSLIEVFISLEVDNVFAWISFRLIVKINPRAYQLFVFDAKVIVSRFDGIGAVQKSLDSFILRLVIQRIIPFPNQH